MMLRAAFVPPEDAVEELRALSGRLGVLSGVHPVPSDRLDVRIAGMGNVGDRDAQLLAGKLEAMPPVEALPEVRWSGVRVLPDGDLGVFLDGDLAALQDVARSVGTCAERIHVYIDRRAFLPLVVVAGVDAQPPGSRLAASLAGLAEWTGGSWTVSEVALIRIRWFAGEAVSEVLDRVPIPVRAHVAQPEQV